MVAQCHRQYLDDTGLLFYNARYYDPGMGRFVSADSIVPGNAAGGMDGIAYKPLTVDVHAPGVVSAVNRENQVGPWFTLEEDERQQLGAPWGPANPQALNRYAYVLNNPMRWTDPDGHCPGCAAAAALFSAAGITISAPVIAAIVAIVAVSAIAAFLSDANNRAWLMEQIHDGIQNVNVFVENLTEEITAFAEQVEETRNGKPAARNSYNTKKEAREAAKRAGKGNKPVNHPDGKHGPHHHPGDDKGKPLNHDHYYYPNRRR